MANLGLVLSGGGARGAYQTGVLRGLLEVADQVGCPNPFSVISGISVGSINGAFMASRAHLPSYNLHDLVQVWETIDESDVFRTDIAALSNIGYRWLRDVTVGGLFESHKAQAFLDTSPLHHLLSTQINYDLIEKNVASGILKAFAVTATDYFSNEAITFVQAHEEFKAWKRPQRRSRVAKINADHIMASSAIPLFFPPRAVEDRFYGDGCLRNTAPLSPPVHLGSEAIIAIGVRKETSSGVEKPLTHAPSVGKVLNTILNAVILDSVHGDVERLLRINSTVRMIPEAQRTSLALRPIDILWIHPTEDIGELARKEAWRLPRVVKYLLGGLGPIEDTAEIVSYLLFDPIFCSNLLEIGYNDVKKRRDEVEEFFVRVLKTPANKAVGS